jgi:hypothetical protein
VSTTVSAVTSGGVLTVASTTGFAVTESVQLTGTPFGGLQVSTTYWIIAIGTGTITLSATLYGTAINITGGTGSMTLNPYRQSGPGFGNTITANTAGDFNTIQAIAAKVLGPPTDAAPTFGYNQTVLSTQVTNGIVYQSNWANLASDLIKARIHQTGNVNEGNNLLIPTTTNLVQESFRKNYYDFAQLVLTNANTFDASQTTIPSSVIASSARGQIWNGEIQSTATLDFGSSAAARAFFNTGGYISVACLLSGSFGTKSALKDNTWAAMFGAMGTIFFNSNSTTIGGGLGSAGYTSTPYNVGFFQLTTNPQIIFTETPPSSGSYASNSFKIYAYRDSSSRYVYMQCQFNDDAGVSTALSTSTYGGDEYVDGILTLSLNCRRASGSYVSLSAPSVSFAGDLQNMSGNPALYDLSADSYYVNEGSTITLTLQTQNVGEGSSIYYNVSGLGATPNGVARYTTSSDHFIISNGIGRVTVTIANDLYTDGAGSITFALTNGLASATVNINDTSITPAGEALITGTYGVYGSGTAYYSGNTFTVPSGIFSLSLYMVGGGGGGGNYAGGGGGGGQVVQTSVAVTPGQQIGVSLGAGGGQGATGGTTFFGSFQALGGYAGANGSGRSGGNGGQAGNGNGGGGGSSSAAGSIFGFAGGGGGGNGGSVSGESGGSATGVTVNGKVDNWYVEWGGGGYGGTTQGGGARYGAGAGTGNPWPSNGLNGSPNTGDGGGGGDAAPATPHGTTRNDAAITSYAGGSGGSGMVIVKWGP